VAKRDHAQLLELFEVILHRRRRNAHAVGKLLRGDGAADDGHQSEQPLPLRIDVDIQFPLAGQPDGFHDSEASLQTLHTI
jgi:hypothetical protein